MLLLLNFIFDAYLFILIARCILQAQGASWHNPFCRFVVNATDFIVKPTQKVLPGWRGLDWAIVFWMVVISSIEVYLLLIGRLSVSGMGFLGVVVAGIGTLLDKFFNVFFYASIFSVLISWFRALQGNAFSDIVQWLAEPVLKLGRRFIPPMGGLDFSPIVVLLALQLLMMFVAYPIINFGMRMLL